LAVTFERVQLDRGGARRQILEAGGVQEVGDAGLREGIADALCLEMGGLLGREGSEDALDLGGGGGPEVAGARERRQLLLLALEQAAQGGLEAQLDHGIAALAIEVHPEHVVGRRLMRELQQRMGAAVPYDRLVAQNEQIDAALPRNAGECAAK